LAQTDIKIKQNSDFRGRGDIKSGEVLRFYLADFAPIIESPQEDDAVPKLRIAFDASPIKRDRRGGMLG
jgi:hypothetical protein